METKVLAKDIYLNLKAFKKADSADAGLILFTVVKSMMKADVDKVFEDYTKILSGEYKVVEVISATELSKDQQSKLEKKISDKLKGTLIFDYQMDKKIKGGIVVRVGDDLIDMSMEKKIQNL